MLSKPSKRQVYGTLFSIAAIVAAITAAPSAPAAAALGSPGMALQKTETTAVAPMGAKAAAATKKARANRPRSAAKDVLEGADGRATTKSVQPLAARNYSELQLNLCNSGFAGCYADGQAVYEGGDLIYYLAPDLVTLNEICANDLPNYLQPSLAEAWPNDWTYYVFVPAVDRRTNGAYHCKNGDEFGNAVLGRVPAANWQGVSAWGGVYTSQDTTNEERTFACAYAIGDSFACATHLTSSSEPIALAQCRALMFDAVPYMKSVEGASGKTIVGGDLNLEYDTADPENAQNCVPSGYIRKGDNAVQHVIFSNDISFVSTHKYGLSYTDHDGFLVNLVKP